MLFWIGMPGALPLTPAGANAASFAGFGPDSVEGSTARYVRSAT
jgi:hypothetical protein